MAGTESRVYVPLTCHGHSRPVTHLSFSGFVEGKEDEYYMISACKGNWLALSLLMVKYFISTHLCAEHCFISILLLSMESLLSTFQERTLKFLDGNPMLRSGINGDW